MSIPESAEPSRLAQFVAFVALAVGLFVFAGWAFGMEQLTNIVPTWPRVVRLTALAYILSGIALWLATVRARVPAIAMAALLTALAALVLLKNAVGWDIYLDQLSLAQMPQILDGNTPPEQAEAVRAGFPNSAHVIVENGGHEDLLAMPIVHALIVRFLGGEKLADTRLSKPALRFVPLDEPRPAVTHPAVVEASAR